jgi:hypothetical protein
LVQLYRRPAEPPSKATIWRVVTGADAAAVDAAISAWLLQRASSRAAPFGENPAGEDPAGQGGTGDGPAHHHHDHHDHGDHHDHDAAAGSSKLLAIAVDGKTVRGATDAEGNQPHLLAAATHHDALVLGQVEVGAKTNEIPMFAPLLDQLAASGVDLAHTVITADALHAQRSHAQYLHERGAGFIFTVKHNQPGLFAALDALPWTDTPIAHRQIDRGTAGSPPAPSRSDPPHPTSRSRTSTGYGWSNATPTTPPARQPPRSPRSASPTCAPIGPARPTWPGSSKIIGTSSRCAGCATPSTAKITPEPAPAPGRPGSWPAYATSESAPCIWPAVATSPKPPAGPAASCTDPSGSSDSRHDQRS